jgi:hypothetical protein
MQSIWPYNELWKNCKLEKSLSILEQFTEKIAAILMGCAVQ